MSKKKKEEKVGCKRLLIFAFEGDKIIIKNPGSTSFLPQSLGVLTKLFTPNDGENASRIGV